MFRKAICFLSAAFALTFISATGIHANQEPVSVEIPVVVEGDSNTTVTIYSDEASMALLDKAEVDNESEFSFTVASNTPGNHVYTITQSVANPTDGVVYDETKFIADVFFEYEDETLTGTAVIYPDGSDAKSDKVCFKNIVPSESSDTGVQGKDVETYAIIAGSGLILIGISMVVLTTKKDETE